MGGGGGAGSPRGTGGCGREGFSATYGGFGTGSGGGLGESSAGTLCEGGGSRGCYGLGKAGSNRQQKGNFQQATRMNCRDDIWWRVEDIGGAGGVAWGDLNNCFFNHQVMSGGSGAGGGAGGISFGNTPTGITCFSTIMASMGGQGGFLGGGGGNIYYCQEDPTQPAACQNYIYQACPTDGRGGYAGGAGGGAEGMPGVVIIYW